METHHPTDDTRVRGRDAFQRQSWVDAYADLSAADRTAPLGPDDLAQLASAAHLVGREDEAMELLTRAHNGYLAAGDEARASRCAFWLAFSLVLRGERSRAAGWVARARRMLDNGQRDCVECGYLLLPVAFERIAAGDVEGALATFREAMAYGERFHELDLINMARLGQGRALIRLDQPAEGISLLDEVMVSVTAGEVSPTVAGDLYCAVIEGCHETFDLRRAQEWTAALSEWCATQPEPVPYRGPCLLRRAEIMQVHGEWSDALQEAQQARERLESTASQRAVGAAWYQVAEVHRLRGEYARAEDAYRDASRLGHVAQPGLALLRLAQGQVDAASASIRAAGAGAGAQSRRQRAHLLAASVEIMLAAGDVVRARAAADELAAIGSRLEAALLRAMSAGASGAVLLAEGEAASALASLRHAWILWRDLDAPYHAARVRVLVARACRSLGDADTAAMELDAARQAFLELGATADAAALDDLEPVAGGTSDGLTAREREVLGLIATGRTNKAIADALVISEKTVARHVSNIFTKLGLGNRAAATAYAYEHDLVASGERHRGRR